VAIHDDAVSAVKEGLPEYLELARIGISHTKPGGGVLGLASATLLFAVVDAIGSYHRGDPKYTVPMDGKQRTINSTSDHIFILNSPYFGLAFTEDELHAIYRLGRSPLTHNALLGAGQWLFVGEPEREAIESKDEGIHVYLPKFLSLCEEAAKKFLAVADAVVPNSKAVQELIAKGESAYDVIDKKAMEVFAKAFATPPVQVTAVGPSPKGWRRPRQP